MILPDVNVLVYAHREDAPGHDAYRESLETTINGESAFGLHHATLRVNRARPLPPP